MRGIFQASIAASVILSAAAAQAAPLTLNDFSIAGDQFGYAVGLDGGRVLVGARGNDGSGNNVGQAQLFDAATGALLQTFHDPNPTNEDRFGSAVAIGAGGLLVGAPNDDTAGSNVGEVYQFSPTTGALIRTFNDPTPTTNDQFGGAIAISGGRALIGAGGDDSDGLNTGQAHLFDLTTGALLQTFHNPLPNASDLFGLSLALDGDRALIGAAFDDGNGLNVGQAYLFDVTTGALLQTYDDPTPTSADHFGVAVALEGDNVLIGAFNDDTAGEDIGQAYLFDALTANLLRTFDDPTPTSRDFFGVAVALDGGRALIGAEADDSTGLDVGQAFLFDLATGMLLQTFDDPTPTQQGDRFGFILALDGSLVAIGAPDHTQSDQLRSGEVHLFSIAPIAPVPLAAGLPMLGAGIAVFGWLGYRRKKAGCEQTLE